MASNNLDLPKVLDGWVKSATAVGVDANDYSVPNYYVIDIRSQADFDLGHIKNAVRADIGNILEAAANANGKPILVACYTGQTAARAVGALRLMGFDSYVLKWGMSGWHEDLAGKWNSNATDFQSPNWITTGDPATVQEFDSPTFTTGETEGAEILEARVRAMLAKTDWGVSKTDVLSNPGNYFINNKWPVASWTSYGHVTGAYRIDEDLTLANLKYLDPSKPLLTYCYTGQTSAITTMWLDVLGYNGRSMMYGANGIVHTLLLNGADAKSTWHGTGAGSGPDTNFGYYDTAGTLHGPRP